MLVFSGDPVDEQSFFPIERISALLFLPSPHKCNEIVEEGFFELKIIEKSTQTKSCKMNVVMKHVSLKELEIEAAHVRRRA